LPVEEHPQTLIAATLPRADQRDVLLVRADRWEQVRTSGELTVLTSAPRRAHNLKDVLPTALPAPITQLNFAPVRGNIQTRVQKLFSGDAEGLLIAKAALDRLLETDAEEYAAARAELRAALARCYWMVLPLRLNPTAAAQGALALEARRADEQLLAALQTINCAETYAAVERERVLLRSYGGGCHQAIGVSVLRRAYGEITFVRGLDAAGQALAEARLRPTRPRPPKLTRAALWPLQHEQHDWFTRVALPVAAPASHVPLWIARANALPAAWTIPPTQRVWASGWETWRKLAARGVWVNGCAEGLGEHEPPRLATLHGAPLDWCKLTHAASATESGMRVLATYRLEPRPSGPDVAALARAEYYFWTSGSTFQHALAHVPELRDRVHFCGPGATQQALEAAGMTPHICLDYEQWRAEFG
jgi:hydroxymethylbilane synthase